MVRKRINLKKVTAEVVSTVNYLPGAGGGTAVFGQRRGVDVDDFIGKDIDCLFVEKGRPKATHKPSVARQLSISIYKYH